MELLTVVAVLGILVTLTFPLIEPMRARAERVVCMGNLRSLHVSMSAYLNDHKRWPQCPPDASDLEYDNFWIAAMKPYGVTEKGWLCPSIARKMKFQRLEQREKEQVSRVHYMPSDFDEKPITPHEFPTQPWFMEIGGPHGNGNLLIQGGGNLRELMDIIKELESSN